ncbi:DUF421 domain-containing protein [Bacillus sp. CGMCC 1.16607]|uniref:DUF421 domain-containing protein n=1 Tax=Bacillus sp. CGMCC 1.16607 TaxID=3351842 RepID=UPI0036375E07
MDFFSSQDSLSTVEWCLRAIVGFFFLIVVAKLLGQRSISQLRFLDFVLLLLLGNILAHPLSDEGLGLKGSMITISVLVLLYLVGLFLSLKSIRIRKFFDPSPIPLIENGQINYKNLIKAKITIDVLLSELRREKTEDIQKVALALWEPGGAISIFLNPQHQPATLADLNLPNKPFYLPKTIIKERKIDFNELQTLGKDEQWLINKIKELYNLKVDDVLLATLDQNENLKVFFYK